jgi:exosome complex component RRP42
MELQFSKTEKIFISEGIKNNIRLDGRENFDFRHFLVETGIISQSNGSARVKLGNTEILVGIKAEIGEPDLDFPNKGRIEVNVKWYHYKYKSSSPSIPDFEGKEEESLNNKFSLMLKNLISKG